MIQYSHLDSSISPQSFLSIVSRRRKVILAVFSAILLLMTIAAFVIPPQYESSAKVMVTYQNENEKSFLLGVNGQTKVHYDRLGSELVILKMRSVLEPVVAALDLDKQKQYQKLENHSRAFDEALFDLQKNVTAEREKDTNVLVVSYQDRDPHNAARVVDKVVGEYIEQRPLLSKDERAYEFFEKQITEIKQQIENIEANGLAFKSKSRMIDAESQSQILFSTMADFDKELTRVRTERISKEARLQVIEKQIAQGKEISIPNTSSSENLAKMDYLNEMRSQLLSLELRKSDLAKRYTEKHPDMIAVNRDINMTETKIAAETDKIIEAEQTAVQALRASEDALAHRMNQVANSVAELSRQDYELGMLTIGVQDLKEVYSMLIRQREEARIAANRKEYLVQVRLLEPAMIPVSPIKPNKTLMLALGLVLGLIVSLGVAFFIEYFDHAVNTAEDAQQCLGLPILATIPEFNRRYLEAGQTGDVALEFAGSDKY